jgi:hypothetical protein
VRSRRDEWERAGVFDTIANEALRGYDKVIGLRLGDTAVDGSLHKAPAGGEGTGKNPTDRSKLGWKVSYVPLPIMSCFVVDRALRSGSS